MAEKHPISAGTTQLAVLDENRGVELKALQFTTEEYNRGFCSNDASPERLRRARARHQHRLSHNVANARPEINRHSCRRKEFFFFPPLFPPRRVKHWREHWVSVDTRLGCDVFAASSSTVASGSFVAWTDIQSARSGKRPRVGLLFSGPERIQDDGPKGGNQPPEAMTIPWGRDGFVSNVWGSTSDSFREVEPSSREEWLWPIEMEKSTT